MREAVIVSTARTPIGKAYRGAFNDTQAQALGAHAISHAVQRAGIEGGEVEDVIMGAALQQGCQTGNIGRQAAMRAGLPTTVPGMSIDRQCGSGLMAIAAAAKQIIFDGQQVNVGGGLESISLVQNANMNVFRMHDPWLKEHLPAIVTGKPARSALCRATLKPWLPCWTAAPMTTSSISAGSTPARFTASAMAWPPSACACVSLKAPR